MTDTLIDILERCKADVSPNDVSARTKRFIWECAIEEVRHYQETQSINTSEKGDCGINWNEDSTQYLNKCGICGETFSGNKGRGYCKKCVQSTKASDKPVIEVQEIAGASLVGFPKPEIKAIRAQREIIIEWLNGAAKDASWHEPDVGIFSNSELADAFSSLASLVEDM